MITDTNAGNGMIPNGTYTYTVIQSDLAGNPSAVTAASTVVVTVKANLPATPIGLTLDAGSNTGAPNDAANLTTRDNNGNPYPAPQFDVAGGLVAGFTLELFRSPVVDGVTGTAVLVNSVIATGASGTIIDTNAGDGMIPDGTYVYTAKQVDLSGNVSLASNGVTVTISTAAPTVNPPTAAGPRSRQRHRHVQQRRRHRGQQRQFLPRADLRRRDARQPDPGRGHDPALPRKASSARRSWSTRSTAPQGGRRPDRRHQRRQRHRSPTARTSTPSSSPSLSGITGKMSPGTTGHDPDGDPEDCRPRWNSTRRATPG